MSRQVLRRALALTSGLVLATTLMPPLSATNPSPDDVADLRTALAQSDTQVDKLVEIDPVATGPVTAFVEVSAEPVVDAVKANAAPQQAAATVQSQAKTVADSITDADARVLFVTENAIAGFAVEGDAQAIAKLAERDDVISVRTLPEDTAQNTSALQLSRAVQAWQAAGNTGKDVNIAIIDSGVDFTHKTFGGSGDYTPFMDESARNAAVTWPQGKVLGGWDYVGDQYTGKGAGVPDPNPIDVPLHACSHTTGDEIGGHGTHVAGTAAGYGVTETGETFTGDYQSLSPATLQSMQVGPGTAPEANIIALKVFGCRGRTNYTAKALDDLLAKEPDGTYKWNVDVVNMSLSSSYGSTYAPHNIIIKRLFEERGVVSVTSAGNAGDNWDTAGYPGNAPESLSVARTGVYHPASAEIEFLDELKSLTGFPSMNYGWPDIHVPDVAVSPTVLEHACEPLAAPDASALAGKAVLVRADQPCATEDMFDVIEAAGGVAVFGLETPDATFSEFSGNTTLPGIALSAAKSQQLLDKLEASDGTFAVSLWHYPPITGRQNQLDESSSRGMHGSYGVVKPDVAAPGTAIWSAAVSSGNKAQAKDGTSMSAPHVAGILAVSKAAKPHWNATQLKANIINTAFHDVNNGSIAYGPQRVGSGRVDALAAVENNVVMYDTQASSLTSVNFGIVEFPQAGYSATRSVTVENLGTNPADLSLAYQSATAVPGVSFSVTPTALNVPAGGKAEVTITAHIDAAAYQKVLDPTKALAHDNLIKEYLSTATGRLVATGTGAPAGGDLRLPVSMAPKPVSALHGSVAMAQDAKSGTVDIAGETFSYQPAYAAQGERQHQPIVMAFQHVADSPQLYQSDATVPAAPSLATTDLKTVGVNTTLQQLVQENKDHPDKATPLTDAQVVVGVETWAPWNLLPHWQASIDLEVVANGNVFHVVGKRSQDISFYEVTDDVDQSTGKEFTNGVPGAMLDMNSFDTSVIAVPFTLGSVGITEEQIAAGNVDLQISVIGRNNWAKEQPALGLGAEQADRVDFSYNPTNVKFTFDNTLGAQAGLHLDGTPMPFTYDAAGAGAIVKTGAVADQIMLLHFHNKVGDQVELLPLEIPEKPEPPVSPEPTDPPGSPEPTDPPGTPTAQPTNPGQPPKPWLPITGSNAVLPALLAAGLFGAGGVLISRRYAR